MRRANKLLFTEAPSSEFLISISMFQIGHLAAENSGGLRKKSALGTFPLFKLYHILYLELTSFISRHFISESVE